MEEKLLIKITDKGAIMGAEMSGNFLLQLSLYKKEYPKIGIDELILKTTNQLKKEISWLKRENDNTTTEEDKKQATENAEEIIKFTEKIWKNRDI